MIPGLYYALSAIKAGTDRFQVSSNNVANISTPGYKTKVSYISELSKGGVAMFLYHLIRDRAILSIQEGHWTFLSMEMVISS